jgi:predicted nucleotidyltransferase component of viral defense system
MISPAYRAQVDLLLRILPHVAKEDLFALKGGTAINLFVRDMPRFSVDIDLTYLPLDARVRALNNISSALGRLREDLEKAIPGLAATALPQREGQDAKLVCRAQQAVVKIEVNTIMRGHLWPTRSMQLTQATQAEFGKFAAINIVSHPELFGGKICAALDRQHPRDLFDIDQLFAHEGLSDELRLGFLASLLSHPRPLHEIIRPHIQDRRSVYDNQFTGMTIQPFTYEEFQATRERLVGAIQELLTDDDRAFLLTFKNGEPNWGMIPLEALREMPAVQWKLSHIRKLKRNANKHAAQLKALEQALSR